MMCAPGSISQMTSICSPRLSSSIDDKVTQMLWSANYPPRASEACDVGDDPLAASYLYKLPGFGSGTNDCRSDGLPSLQRVAGIRPPSAVSFSWASTCATMIFRSLRRA